MHSSKSNNQDERIFPQNNNDNHSTTKNNNTSTVHQPMPSTINKNKKPTTQLNHPNRPISSLEYYPSLIENRAKALPNKKLVSFKDSPSHAESYSLVNGVQLTNYLFKTEPTDDAM